MELEWVIPTPFGEDVVPEVYIKYAISFNFKTWSWLIILLEDNSEMLTLSQFKWLKIFEVSSEYITRLAFEFFIWSDIFPVGRLSGIKWGINPAFMTARYDIIKSDDVGKDNEWTGVVDVNDKRRRLLEREKRKKKK